MLAVLLCCASLAAAAAPSGTDRWLERQFSWGTISWTDPDSTTALRIATGVDLGISVIRTFFNTGYPHSFSVTLFPSRASLDTQWQQDWADSSFHGECWMVASGVANRLDLLSPRIWGTEACEHRGDDSAEVAQVIVHEMVHVFHAQHNPKPDFAGLDSLAWFMEGLATYVSGQLTDRRLQDVRELLAQGKGPTRLSTIWTGKARYGNAGSLVEYIDRTFGRRTLIRMLGMTDQAEMLGLLNTDELSLLRRWTKSLQR